MVGSNTLRVFLLLLLDYIGGDAQYDNCTAGRIDWIADAFCDIFDVINNSEECGYDGGDCCECTCEDTLEQSCGANGYLCVDPNSGCIDPLIVKFPNCTGNINYMADGKCDISLNNEDCGYDDGDCCECTCVGGSSFACGANDFLCLDPASGCVNPIVIQYANCTGYLAELADGYCQDSNNNGDCGYDGGDCCQCTCIDSPEHSCSADNSFACVDPNAPSVLYNCEEPPPPALPCATDLVKQLSVENTADVNNMADAVYCTGGSFEIEWRGDILVTNTVYIIGGTVVNITGVGSSAILDGGNTTRIFTVVNASLHLANVMVGHGNAISGGAILASSSILALSQATFFENTAVISGGALDISGRSSVVGREAFFFSNKGKFGSALYLTGGSNASWTGNIIFSNNIADRCGALSVNGQSSVSFVGVNTFSGNTASFLGGALYVTGRSSAYWAGEMNFTRNIVDSFGGAVVVTQESIILWNGETNFLDNNASSNVGGALIAADRSHVSWSGWTTFSDNSADSGGALFVYNSSSVSWSGKTTFLKNIAVTGDGGAIEAVNSAVSWSGDTLFFANNAEAKGGAMFVIGSRISWSADTMFSHNSADDGGALFLMGGSSVEWTGETTFLFNRASSDGGAIGFSSTGSLVSSALVINGTTTFERNTCEANGGGIVVQDMLLVEFETKNVTFIANSAKISGGAIFISGTGVGPTIRGASFLGNIAQTGGGVYATGSGAVGMIREGESYPTTFDGCRFFDNVAETSGGAVNSALGQDYFSNTMFLRNQAGVGGALHLAGTASLDRCSFQDNVSGVGGGAAVSNIGSIAVISNISFIHNVLSCDEGTFLTFSNSRNFFETVCVGCSDACKDCYFDKTVPTCVALSEAGVEHADSPGGVITVENLIIHKGYWRATTTSTNVLECYNKKSCLGGVGIGSCNQGYEGPYCSVCSETYTDSLGFTCKECSNSTIGIVVVTALTAACVAVGVGVVLHLLSGGIEGTGEGLVGRITRIVPLQAVKIVIVAWQILIQFASVTSVTFPDVYQRFLDGMSVLNFDLGWMLSAACIVGVNFHGRMLISTIGPLIVLMALSVTYVAARIRNRMSEETLRCVQYKHMSMVILVTFLVYSSASSAVFKMFDCEHLDDGNIYLRADHTILCRSTTHRALQVYAGIMVIIYPFGIPALYSWVLFQNRAALTDKNCRENDASVQSTSTLWRPYKPSRFYFEVIECIRRILLTGVAMLADDNAAAKIAATLVVAVFFLVLVEVIAPYESRLDAWVSRAGNVVVYTTVYFALLLKVDVSNERQSSQSVFEAIIVTTHVGMISAVMVEIVLTAWSSFKPTYQREHCFSVFSGRKIPAPVDTFDFET